MHSVSLRNFCPLGTGCAVVRNWAVRQVELRCMPPGRGLSDAFGLNERCRSIKRQAKCIDPLPRPRCHFTGRQLEHLSPSGFPLAEWHRCRSTRIGTVLSAVPCAERDRGAIKDGPGQDASERVGSLGKLRRDEERRTDLGGAINWRTRRHGSRGKA